jgi:hypothetical protein
MDIPRLEARMGFFLLKSRWNMLIEDLKEVWIPSDNSVNSHYYNRESNAFPSPAAK